MEKWLSLILAFSLALPSFGLAASGVTVLSVSLDQISEAPRWMFDGQVKAKGGKLIDLMVEAKKALIGKERAKCLKALEQSYSMGKSLAPWLMWNQLQCAQLPDRKGIKSLESLSAAINKIEQQPRWLLYGPYAGSLKIAYVNALLALAEQQVKSDRRFAWKTLDKLQSIRHWLTGEERASVYRWGGELAFVEQNLTVAQDFLVRSLNEKDNAELRVRVASIRKSLETDKKEDTKPPAPPVPPADVGMSDEERELVTRMDNAYETQDYISAIEDATHLLSQFPGSRRASEAADRVLEIYSNVSLRSEDKFRHVHETILRQMEKVDPTHLARWASAAYIRGNYADSLHFATKSFAKYGDQPEGSKMLLLAGKAAVACGEYKQAHEYLELLLRQASGTDETVEATFRLGLLNFRETHYQEATAFFERLMALKGNRDYEYRALYWQWRAQQKIALEKSATFAQLLISKFPLSYYGLRAKAELADNELILSDKPISVKTELRLLDNERLAWERLNILLKAGWLKEAEKELEVLPEPQSPLERLVRAKLWGGLMRYDLAVTTMNKALEENPELQQLSLLRMVFPKEYSKWIVRESAAVGVSDLWIRSLIRQESTFRPDAKSTSNALGVMQLLPATASELANDYKIKNFQIPDSLFDPELNIKLGSTYFSRMIKNFNGNIPLAIAAYNAGPSRLRRWLGARKDLNVSSSSSPEVELWMDELPWDETSFYVKAVLRNWLLYRLMDGSKVVLSEPIWLDANAGTR